MNLSLPWAHSALSATPTPINAGLESPALYLLLHSCWHCSQRAQTPSSKSISGNAVTWQAVLPDPGEASLCSSRSQSVTALPILGFRRRELFGKGPTTASSTWEREQKPWLSLLSEGSPTHPHPRGDTHVLTQPRHQIQSSLRCAGLPSLRGARSGLQLIDTSGSRGCALPMVHANGEW